LVLISVGDFGVVAEEKPGEGPGPLLDGDRPGCKDEAGGLVALAEREASLDGRGVAEDCDR